MEEYKKMIIDLKYYLCCETEEFILDFLGRVKTKIPVWVKIYSAGDIIKEFNNINASLPYYISKNDIPETNITIPISSIINYIEKHLLLSRIKSLVEDNPDYTTVVLSRLTDQFSKGHITNIPIGLITIGLEDATYPNRVYPWNPIEFIDGLVRYGVIELDDKNSTITILRPDLFIIDQ